MSSSLRGARLLLSTGVEKAMPSRMPEKQADKNATAMMGHPLRTIQQGPTACPSCGRNHRAGTVCFNKSTTLLDVLFKGTITISGQRRGNPYRDEATGHFAASPGGAGGAAGGGGGGGLGARTQENTVMGAPAPQAAPKKPTMEGQGIGHASTGQGPAPAAPAAAGAGPKTMPGKEPVKNQTGISPSMIARHEAQQQQDQGYMDALMQKPKEQLLGGPKPVFSHQGAQEAYEGEKARAMGSGASNEEAHAAGMKAGASAYANAIRPAGQAPAAPKPTMQGGAATTQSPAPQMSGPGGTQVTGAPTGMSPAPAAPGGAPGITPSGGAPTPPGGGGGASGGQGKTGQRAGGGKAHEGLLEQLIKPWESAAGGLGSSAFTSGAGVTTANSALGGSAHGLLHYMKQDQPASNQHQQKQQSAQKQSGFLANQQQAQQNSTRRFAGQAAGATPPNQAGMRPSQTPPTGMFPKAPGAGGNANATISQPMSAGSASIRHAKNQGWLR